MPEKKINVLVFPAGEINSIELHDALCTCVNIKLFGASSIDRHGEYVFKNYISGVPMISDKNFLPEFNKLIAENKIDVVFPTHDTIAEFFAKNNDKISAKIIVADEKTTKICRDKEKTFELFKNENFCPKVYKNIVEFPVFIKPKIGQGAVGAKLINDEKDIPANLDDFVISEYLTGEEFTVDCFTDKNGELKVICPRSRQRVFGGVCVAGQSETLTDEIKKIANKVNEKLKFNGLWFFQIKKDKFGKFKLLEISTRVAGTMCLARAMGVNIPLLSVYNAMGYDVEVLPNSYELKMDRTLISRYKMDYEYDTVYFDFDDTLIIDEQVHLAAIKFLYQCKNQGKKVVLITRHDKELPETFEKHAISQDLFSEIIKTDFDTEKTEFINPKGAIFIDNAHKERKKVKEKFNIPVFDVEGLEVLLDWRV